MPGLQSYAAFAETARHGSFAAAARELGSSPSTLAKAVTRLERSLGVKLLHRTTRRVALTTDGERLFQRCQRVLAEIDEMHSEAAATRASPRGTLRIDMPITYGRRVLLPMLTQLVRRHPELALDARLHDEPVDLVKEGIDVAIRIGALRDSRLVARRFASQTLLLCASPGYLAERGHPKRIDSLTAHTAIVFRMPSSGRDRPWQFRARGREIELHPVSRLRLNDGESMVAAACLGLGLVQVPAYMVRDEVEDGRLVEVLRRHRPDPMPISAVYAGARLLPARVRTLFEALDALRDADAGGPPVCAASDFGNASGGQDAP